jgi:5-methylcytosine-specific restriction protein A
MPNKPLHFCRHPGCNRLTDKRLCDIHQAEEDKRYDEQRGSAAERGYDHHWKRFRLRYLAKHPLCVRCEEQGRLTPATLIHHVVPLKDGGAKYDESNLMALCNSCHEDIEGPARWKQKGTGKV